MSLRLLSTAVLATALGAAHAARANGAFPDELSIHFPPNSPHRILVGVNFGLLVSEDDGATWRYSCEPYVTTGSSDPLSSVNVNFYQVAADDTVLADAINITRSPGGSDVGCTWPTSGGTAANAVITDIFPDPNDASFVLANVASATGGLIIPSTDGGATFGPAVYTTTDVLTGLEIGRATPPALGVVYATHIATNGSSATLTSSHDRLQTKPVAGCPPGSATCDTPLNVANGTQARILAVDPDDPKTVYLRLYTGLNDNIGIVTDGLGGDLKTILTIAGAFSSFVRANDGTLYAGTLDGDLYVRPPSAKDFSHRPGPHLRCLGQRRGVANAPIYACGDMFLDGFSIGSSTDGGQTFQKVMKFTELQGLLTCPQVQTACAAHWDRIQGVLGLGGTPDAGTQQPDGGTTPPTKSSSCASVGAGAAALLLLAAYSLERGRR